MTDDNDDRKAKDVVIDAATQRDLERWFGLPTFTQLADEGKQALVPTPELDPQMAAVIERRDKALANVDPVLLDSLLARHANPEALIVFEKTIDVRVAETNFGAIDEVLVQRTNVIAEPREYEPSDELRDDMKDCTPQAMLRDLHRPEKYFDKELVRPDLEEEGLAPVDPVKEVQTAMTTRWTLPKGPTPLDEAKRLWTGVRADRARNWLDYLPAFYNRSTTE